ncbi:MAG TPA: hypothetical protein VFY04_08700 [Solirubrobacterales bacterium]|nr:hypothetical protein [Solirubrobacterales bacterium]
MRAELQLPAGAGTFVERFYNPNEGQDKQTATSNPGGWSCTALPPSGAQPAKAICERSDPLTPGSSYPPFAVAVALGTDAPDIAVATATVSGGGTASPATAVSEFTFAPAKPFGIEAFETSVPDELGAPYTQAGGHPFSAGAAFSFNKWRERTPESAGNKFKPVGRTKTVRTETPRGFVGNALAIEERCPSAEDVILRKCPVESAVGGIELVFADGGAGGLIGPIIYAIEPEFGRPAQFAFTESVVNGLYTFYPRLRPEDGYAITLESAPLPASFPTILAVDAVVCGFGVATKLPGPIFDRCKGRTDPTANPKPLITVPTRCDGPPPTTRLAIDSWENPGEFVSATFSDPPLTGCEKVKFEPEMALEPTSNQADSPTGMDVEIFMPTDGLESKTGISQANLKRVSVKLPEGMAVNASAGHGLEACTAAHVGIDPNTGVPDDQEASCPDSSKIGTIAITTPLIEEKLTGDVFIAKQGKDNPFDSNIALYMVFSSKKDGITIKLAGEVRPDPQTGQMEIVFDENPEAPFSSVEMHFPQGPRSPLLNPPSCGTHKIEAVLTPWTGGAPVVQNSFFQVTEGPGGGPCPSGGLDASLTAGVSNPIAGQTSDFMMRLSRPDGSQRFKSLTLTPPLGLTAYLKGVPYCPDSVLGSISGAPEAGQGEIDSPSCPAASRIGTASAGAGAGPDPLYVETGKAYLAGPYKGAPLSIAVVTPAVAGPLDLGNVVIRNAVHINPETAQIRVVSDEIPRILHGVLLNIRDIRVNIDRPDFTLNPTSCAEKQVGVDVSGEHGGFASLADRFQVTDCASLGFKPRMALRLFGGTGRGAYQGVRAVVRPRPGEANISSTVVRFPRSAFVAQEHIRTICTRVQFAADKCPKGSIYGRAIARSPLIDYPLRGNVYLRSSDNELPDAVADLRGPAHQPVRIEVAVRNDSVGGALRNTVLSAPDAPVSFFRLQLFGKEKGLIVNSRNVCRGANEATVVMGAHNGRRSTQRTPVFNRRCAKQRRAKRSAHRSQAQAARHGGRAG